MAQLPCIGLSYPLTKPPFGGCAIYFPDGIYRIQYHYELHLCCMVYRVTLNIHLGSLHAHIYIYIYIIYVSTSTMTFIQMSCHVISPAKKCHVFLLSSSLPFLATWQWPYWAKDIGLMSDGAFTALGAKQTEVPRGWEMMEDANIKSNVGSCKVLLMVQKSGKLTSWYGKFPIIDRGLYISQVVSRISSIKSIFGMKAER